MNMLPHMNKDDVQKEASRIANESGYTIKNGIVNSPGKFEGESIETLYFYDCYLNGDGCVMKVTEEEKQAFDLQEDCNWVYLAEENQGFVTLEYYSTEAEAEERESEEYTEEYTEEA